VENQNFEEDFLENHSIITSKTHSDEINKDNCSITPQIDTKSETFTDHFDLNVKRKSKKMLEYLKKNPLLKKTTTWSFSD
jgi:hypothetical protein